MAAMAMAMVMVVAATGRDGGGSEGNGGGGLGNDAGGDNNYGGVCEGDGGGGLGEGSVGEGEGGAGDGGGFERTIPERVPSPQHRDFWDQHDEPRRFCAGVAFQRLLRARLPQSHGSPAPHGAITASPAQRKKNELCS